jgi:pantetheine-phosphate adenylyltransferase
MMTQINKAKKTDKKSGVYAGTFSPVTRGHLDIIYQAACLMDTLYIMVGVNHEKEPIFSDDERIDMIKHDIRSLVIPKLRKNGHRCEIKVAKHDGLTAAFMKAHDAPYYIRGLRLGMEFDHEYPSLIASKGEYDKFTPLFLCSADPYLQIVSSSLVREIERFGGKSAKKYVTPYVANKLKEKLKQIKNKPG